MLALQRDSPGQKSLSSTRSQGGSKQAACLTVLGLNFLFCHMESVMWDHWENKKMSTQ